MKTTPILRAAVGLALFLTALPANWPKQWAQDVLPVAGSVYRQITLTTPGAQAGHWNVTVTPAFETGARELTDKQLAKAGYRLAEVLKKILP